MFIVAPFPLNTKWWERNVTLLALCLLNAYCEFCYLRHYCRRDFRSHKVVWRPADPRDGPYITLMSPSSKPLPHPPKTYLRYTPGEPTRDAQQSRLGIPSTIVLVRMLVKAYIRKSRMWTSMIHGTVVGALAASLLSMGMRYLVCIALVTGRLCTPTPRMASTQCITTRVPILGMAMAVWPAVGPLWAPTMTALLCITMTLCTISPWPATRMAMILIIGWYRKVRSPRHRDDARTMSLRKVVNTRLVCP